MKKQEIKSAAALMGAKGGQSRSARKIAAARKNGLLGWKAKGKKK